MKKQSILLALFLIALCAITSAEDYKGFPRGEALITPVELNSLIDSGAPGLVVIGVLPAGPFARAHIPGSNSAWPPDYTTAKDDSHPLGGMMVDREQFQEFARSLGINDDSEVVLYDTSLHATRLWWAFFLHGKTDVRILDGGFDAWKAAKHEIETGAGSKRNSNRGLFTARPAREGWNWTMDKIQSSEHDQDVQLVDSREPDEWSGKRKVGGAARAGRIGWAQFLNWKEFRNLANSEAPMEFKTAAEIQGIIDANGLIKDKHQVFYCQSGVRASTGIFALYLMGWDPDTLHSYDGSWLEWSNDPDNPVVVD